MADERWSRLVGGSDYEDDRWNSLIGGKLSFRTTPEDYFKKKRKAELPKILDEINADYEKAAEASKPTLLDKWSGLVHGVTDPVVNAVANLLPQSVNARKMEAESSAKATDTYLKLSREARDKGDAANADRLLGLAQKENKDMADRNKRNIEEINKSAETLNLPKAVGSFVKSQYATSIDPNIGAIPKVIQGFYSSKLAEKVQEDPNYLKTTNDLLEKMVAAKKAGKTDEAAMWKKHLDALTGSTQKMVDEAVKLNSTDPWKMGATAGLQVFNDLSNAAIDAYTIAVGALGGSATREVGLKGLGEVTEKGLGTGAGKIEKFIRWSGEHPFKSGIPQGVYYGITNSVANDMGADKSLDEIKNDIPMSVLANVALQEVIPGLSAAQKGVKSLIDKAKLKDPAFMSTVLQSTLKSASKAGRDLNIIKNFDPDSYETVLRDLNDKKINFADISDMAQKAKPKIKAETPAEMIAPERTPAIETMDANGELLPEHTPAVEVKEPEMAMAGAPTKATAEVVATQTPTNENAIITHGSRVPVEQIQKEGFKPGKNSQYGEAAFFSDSGKTTNLYATGDNNISVDPKKFNLKTFDTLSDEQRFINDMDATNIAEAIKKEGKFDGFIIPNKNPEVGNTYGITNIEKLNQEIQNIPTIKEKPVKAARDILPVSGTGDEKISRLEARVTSQLDKAPDEIKEGIGISTYNEMKKPEQIKAATKWTMENPDDAIAVLKGEKQAPKGILRNSIYVAMENQAKGDVDLARKLASLESTRFGQELSILTELDPHNPVRVMREIRDIRAADFERKTGKKVSEAVKETVGELKKEIKTTSHSRQDWESFINEIRC